MGIKYFSRDDSRSRSTDQMHLAPSSFQNILRSNSSYVISSRVDALVFMDDYSI